MHGAVLIGGTLFYAKSDKMLYSRTFNGTTYGAEQQVNPYSDPLWDNVVDAGRGRTTRRSKARSPTSTPSCRRSRRWLSARTPTGSTTPWPATPNLYYRAFSPDSGVVYPIATAVTGVSMAHTTGLVLSGGSLWFADGTTGNLSRVGLGPAGFTGSPVVVSGPATGGPSWAAGTLFTAP